MKFKIKLVMSRITMTVLSVLILISACTSGSKTGTNRQLPVYLDAVSYTHLTLPTSDLV